VLHKEDLMFIINKLIIPMTKYLTWKNKAYLEKLKEKRNMEFQSKCKENRTLQFLKHLNLLILLFDFFKWKHLLV